MLHRNGLVYSLHCIHTRVEIIEIQIPHRILLFGGGKYTVIIQFIGNQRLCISQTEPHSQSRITHHSHIPVGKLASRIIYAECTIR